MSATTVSLKEIFAEALRRTDPAERAEYLAAACPDAAVRQRIEALLRASEDPASFLDPAVKPHFPDATATTTYESVLVGTVIAGRYKLLEAIGEGGMGTVWVAEQMEPVRRKVALKLIKAGMDSKSVLARFEAERQALAVMDHPNIAKILDGGIIDRTPLAPREDGQPLAEREGYIGRPFFVMEYVKGVPITEYCDATRLSVADRLNLFMQVCSAVQHAHQKGIIHRDLKPSNILVAPYDDKPVPKVIDFGLAKAIHHSLTERTLHTAHETVLGTPLYMSPEQAQLNNLDVDTRSDIYSLGVLLYELLTGTTPLEKQRFKEAAWDEVKRIIREEEPPRPSTRLSSSNTLASLAVGRQTEPARLTKLVRGELDWIVMKALEKDRGRRYDTANGLARDIQRYLSDEPVEACPPSATYRLRKFAKKNRTALTTAAAIALLLIAGVAVSTWQAVRARQAQQAALDARRAEAERAEGERLAKFDAQAQEKLAVEQRARAESARDRTRDALDAMTSEFTGDSLSTQKEISSDQKRFLTEVLTYYREFAGEKANDEQTRSRTANAAYRVGMIEYRLGRMEQSVAAVRMALDGYQTLAADFPTVKGYRQYLAANQNYLGTLLAELGKREEAEEQLRQALAIRKKLAADFPAVSEYRRDLAVSHVNLGFLFARAQKGTEAQEQYEKALPILERLHAESPTVADYHRHLANCHHNLGDLLLALGKLAEAETQFRTVLALMEKLVADFPAVPSYRDEQAGGQNELGIVLARLGKHKEAKEQLRKGLETYEKLAADFPAVRLYQIRLGGSYCTYGNRVGNSGRAGETLAWFDKAIATLEPVHRAEPHDVTAKRYLRNSYGGRGQSYLELGKFAEAVKDWGRAVELSPPDEQPGLRAKRANSRVQAGQVAEAVAEVTALTAPVANAPGSPKWTANQWYNFACVYAVASGKIADKKQEYADRAMQLLTLARAAGYKDAAHMKKDTDLDPLRDRADFTKLMAELEKRP